MTKEFPVVIGSCEANNGYKATALVTPTTVVEGWGDTKEEALRDVEDAIGKYFASAYREGLPLPEDSSTTVAFVEV